jgi:methionine-R-sulfoxide reductase
MSKIEKSDAEWREALSPEAYRVLREHGTERAGTSPLNHEKRKGVFTCAGCGKELFASGTKFESGTGWPSFYAPLAEAPWKPPRTAPGSCAARRCIAPIAAATWATSSPMAPSPRGSAIA